MNQLMLVVVAVVALCYCGGNYCPAILKKNKEMLLGVAVGMALCSFMDLRMEGLVVQTDVEHENCCDTASQQENQAYCDALVVRPGFNFTEFFSGCNP
jgi:hypothetical protein